jgi:ATP-dependent Clp protease, protease subunit
MFVHKNVLMVTPIYLYQPIYSYVAESFAKQLNNANGSDVNVRLMTNGGYTSSGSAIITHLANYKGKKIISVDGDVASMGAFILLFGDFNEMSNTSELMFHKADFPSYYTPSDEEKANLARENERFKSIMESKLGEKGASLISKVFEEGKRNDVYLTAKEALEIGIIQKIVEISPEQKAAMNNEYLKSMMNYNKSNEQSNNSTMEVDEKKLKEAADKAADTARQEEQERTDAWMVYLDVDKQAVIAGIKSGKKITEVDRSEFSLKVAKASKLAEIKDETPATSVPPVATTPVTKTAEQLRQEEIDADRAKMVAKLKGE